MRLPEPLQNAIEQECTAFPADELRRFSQQLTRAYGQSLNSAALFKQPAARAAYLAVRMPATYAAIYTVLRECRKRMRGEPPKTFLDLGAGPGTGSWAAADIYPELESICLLEQSQAMAEVGRRLAKESEWSVLQQAKWNVWSLEEEIPSSEVALLAYLVAELRFVQIETLLERVWEKTQTIVVVEPGTPEGYQRILSIRDWALCKGGVLIAPCPHCQKCPMREPVWCHFPARVERTRMHKFLKSATLGYEDEKFSYLAFGKNLSNLPRGRVVGRVKKGSGFVQLPLCTEGKLETVTVSRRQENYRLARDAEWGAGWEQGTGN